MDVDKRWVGAILRLTREYRGVSREQMATECGVSAGTISHWETGRVLLNAAQLATWARVCGVDLELLAREAGLQDTPSNPPPPTVLRGWYRARQSAPVPAVEVTGNLPDNRRAGGPVRTVRGEVIRKDDVDQDGVIQSYPGPAVRELAFASR
jgi:transcriptional regulator with XRE-family HTH domain